MFRATMCPSAGAITVSMRHLVFVTLCGWLSGMQGGMFHSTLHTRQSSTHIDKYQVSHTYSYCSWWWAHSRPKHVEKSAPSWLYLQVCTHLSSLTCVPFFTLLKISNWRQNFKKQKHGGLFQRSVRHHTLFHITICKACDNVLNHTG